MHISFFAEPSYSEKEDPKPSSGNWWLFNR